MTSGGRGRSLVVGVISDTHGDLPDEVSGIFEGVDVILHAGDVGAGHVLDLLRAIAPVTAVRGNCDRSGEAALLPTTANVAIGPGRFLVAHELRELVRTIDPAAAGIGVVVTGHSHRPRVETRDGVVYMDPGSAADGRSCPRAVGLVVVHADGSLEPRIVELGGSGLP